MTAQRLNQLDDAHRDATLVAFLLATEEELIDQTLDMHDKLLHQQGKRGEQKQEDRLNKVGRPSMRKFGSMLALGKLLLPRKKPPRMPTQPLKLSSPGSVLSPR